jgi:hypothetical protein
MDEVMAIWAEWVKPSAGLPTVQWSLLLAVAAAAGHLLQRHTGLPKVVGYSIVGTLAGLAGFSGAAWPLQGVALFLLELGVSVVLFEVGRPHRAALVPPQPDGAAAKPARVGADRRGRLLRAALAGRARQRGRRRGADRDGGLAGGAEPRDHGHARRRAGDRAGHGAVHAEHLLRADAGERARRHAAPGRKANCFATLYPGAVVLGVSFVVGAVLALALRSALRVMSPTSENTSILLIALVAAGTALAAHFGGSAPLAALLGGLLLKQLHPRPWAWPRQLGTAPRC